MKPKTLILIILSLSFLSCEDCEDRKDEIKEQYIILLEAAETAKKVEMLKAELKQKLSTACD